MKKVVFNIGKIKSTEEVLRIEKSLEKEDQTINYY